MDHIQDRLIELYERTMRNCFFYEKEVMMASLLNEIGVLRGIAYCMEATGLCPHTPAFLHFIEIQQMCKSNDERK